MHLQIINKKQYKNEKTEVNNIGKKQNLTHH
jgi:hypothetical protein